MDLFNPAFARTFFPGASSVPEADVVFIPSDVAVMMALLKVAREVAGRGKLDNVVDLAGYAGLYSDIRYGVSDGD